jgi:ubiquinone biosynthesis protein
VAQELKPKRVAAEAYKTATDYRRLVREFPEDANEILKLLKAGKLGVRMNINGLERLRQTLERVSFRFVHSAVLASLVIGSSIMLGTDVPPTWRGISLFGVIGLSFAAVMGLASLVALVVRIFRR